ncbi:sulfatase [Opitutales bacterium]|nr:sulfatase [Opitutales bacterium]
MDRFIKLYAHFLLLTLGCLPMQGSLNVIYLNADDLGVMDVGFMGSKLYHTPNLDQLAKESMVFTDGYAPAANCAPSRAACFSGQWAVRTGVYTVGTSERGDAKDRMLIPTPNRKHLEDEVITIAEEFKKVGYRTAQLGKWHLGEDPTTQGIDINVGGNTRGAPPTYFSPYQNPNLKDGPKGEYLTDRLTDEAITILEKFKDDPFFIYFPFYSIHTPLQGRPDLKKKYKNNKQVHADYAAMVECLDENVGRLMGALDELGLRDNTIVLFSSDNGGIRKLSKQDPWRAGKGSYYEGGIRVPITVRWPGVVEAGSTCSVPVTGLDFYPTFLDAIEASPSTGKVLDGKSILPLLTGKGSFPKDRTLYWHFPIYLQNYAGEEDQSRDAKFRTRPGTVLRKGKWKLHEYFEDGALLLYDLENDPGETHNLASEKPKRLQALKEDMYAWRKRTGSPVPTKLNPKYVPQQISIR